MPMLLSRVSRRARWSSYNAGHGVELNDEETLAKRRDARRDVWAKELVLGIEAVLDRIGHI